MSAPEIQLLQELRKHPLEIRTLAYALPTGWAADVSVGRRNGVLHADVVLATTCFRPGAATKAISEGSEQ